MYEALRQYAKAYIVAALVGIGMGLGYVGLAIYFNKSLLAGTALRDVISYRQNWKGPSTLFTLSAGAFGVLVGKLVNHSIDTEGLPHWAFILIAAVLSIGIGFGVSYHYLSPMPAYVWIKLAAMCGVFTLVAAGWASRWN